MKKNLLSKKTKFFDSFLSANIATNFLIACFLLLSLPNAYSQNCGCKEYLYVNDVDNNIARKFEIGTTGSLTEILGSGTGLQTAWRPPVNKVSALPTIDLWDPHGLVRDINGFLYISEGVNQPILKFDSRGNLVSTVTPHVENPLAVPGGSGTDLYRTSNFSSAGGYIYAHSDNEDNFWAIDICTGLVKGVIGTGGSNPSININAWGHYNDGRYVYIANRGADEGIYRVPVDPALYLNAPNNTTMPSPVTKLFDINNSNPAGLTIDDEGNFYVIEDQQLNGTGTNIKINKYSPTGTLLATVNTTGSTPFPENTTDGQAGWLGSRSIVFSKSTNLIMVGAQQNVVAFFNKNLVEQTALNLGHSNPDFPSGSTKTLEIIKECCPTTDLTINQTACGSAAGKKYFLQDNLTCGDGIIGEGQWAYTTTNPAITFDPCDLSYTVTTGTGCATFTLQKTTEPGNGNKELCAPFTITLNVCLGPPAATFTVTPPTCTGTTPNNNGEISFATSSGVTHFGVSTVGATMYDGPAFSSSTAFTTIGQKALTGILNTGGNRIVRVFNAADDCFVDVTVPVNTVDCTVLPIGLVNFSGKQNGENVVISWKTENEKNFSHFELQSSINSKEFGTIATVDYNGSSFFSFTDTKAKEGINYYRLKMKDLDGTSTISKMINVKFEKEAKFVTVENPPRNGEFKVITNLLNPKFKLLNLFGSSVNITTTEIGNFNYIIKSNVVTSGIYYLSIEANGKYEISKIFIP